MARPGVIAKYTEPIEDLADQVEPPQTRDRYPRMHARGMWVTRSLTVLCVIVLSGCVANETVAQAEALTGGRVANGKELIYSFACGSCHTIPGIADAKGTVGPPLEGFASRVYIAGSLMNTTDNLLRWVRNPPQIKPGNAMPDLGVTDEQGRHIAAYLYTLH